MPPRAAATATGVLRETHKALGFAVIGVQTGTGAHVQLWYAPHKLMANTGVGDPFKQLQRWDDKFFGKGEEEPYKSAAAQLIKVGGKNIFCVNAHGMSVVLQQLNAPGRVAAQAAVERAADMLNVDLGNVEEEGGEEGEEEEEGVGGEEEEEGADEPARTTRSGKPLNWRTRPRRPVASELQYTASFYGYARETARKAVAKAAAPDGEYARAGAPKVDADRVMLTNEQFFAACAEAVPAVRFRVRTRTAEVDVPPDGGLLLQDFRARSGLLAPGDLQHAMNLARVELEVIFHEDSQKHRGVLHDLGMFAISHGTSQSVIEMFHAAAGSCSAYSTLIQARKETGDRATREFWEKQSALERGEIYIFYFDNFFARARCAQRRARRARGRRWR